MDERMDERMDASNGGRITDELRGWINDNYPAWRKLRTGVSDQLDRIDKAHEEALSRLYMDMSDSEWVRLPKDANGEVIHLGDVVMLPDWPLNHHKVINLVYAHDGWAIISQHGSIEASEHTVHVKPRKPTVEDILTEFARECLTYATCVDDHEVTDAIELYAPKLRLAGDAE